jgi:predicted ribosome quality control (RQC) complex YloA/Tae2 family protein
MICGKRTFSSRRFKDQIADMGDTTNKLLQLRPVTYYYKPQYDNGSHSLQYGLIAEEVAEIYPELAGYDKKGQPDSVKYQLLAPMLLNEFQKQHAVVTAQQEQMLAQGLQIKAQQQKLETQGQQVLAQQQEIEGLKSQLQLQNATFQERLSRLESLVTTQMQTAAADKPAQATTTATGGLQ